MNLFYLDKNPYKCAKALCDKHIVKMILEHVQMLCTIARKYMDIIPEQLYKSTHVNHPVVKWVEESIQNYQYLIVLTAIMGREYTHRYGRKHASIKVMYKLPMILSLPDIPFTQPAQAMDDKYKGNDSVQAYRSYYLNEKKRLFTWKNRIPPKWILSEVDMKYDKDIKKWTKI
jgi:hypothetical protein